MSNPTRRLRRHDQRWAAMPEIVALKMRSMTRRDRRAERARLGIGNGSARMGALADVHFAVVRKERGR